MSDISSIAALGTSLASAQLGQAIATRLAVKAQDTQKAQGQAALSLLESALQVQRTSQAQAAAPGRLDVLA